MLCRYFRPISRIDHVQSFESHLPIKSLFLTIAKVERYSSFLPWCSESKWVDPHHNVGIYSHPISTNATLCVNFGLFNEKFTSTVTYLYPQYVKAIASDDSMFKHMESTWTFSKGSAPNSTLLKFNLSFEFNKIIHQSCARFFISKISHTITSSFINEAKRTLISQH